MNPTNLNSDEVAELLVIESIFVLNLELILVLSIYFEFGPFGDALLRITTSVFHASLRLQIVIIAQNY